MVLFGAPEWLAPSPNMAALATLAPCSRHRGTRAVVVVLTGQKGGTSHTGAAPHTTAPAWQARPSSVGRALKPRGPHHLSPPHSHFHHSQPEQRAAVLLPLSPPHLSTSNPLNLKPFFAGFFVEIEEKGRLLHSPLFFFVFIG